MTRTGAVLGVVAGLWSASSATATIRVADPLGASTECTNEAPCAINTAINGAVEGDEVIVNPGEYGSAGSPITADLMSFADNVTIHGRDGSTRPHIVSSQTFALRFGGSGAVVRDLALRSTYPNNGYGLLLSGSATAERVEIRAGGAASRACAVTGTPTIRDSVCVNTGADGTAFDADSTQCCGPVDATARNVTAVATGSSSADQFGDGVRVLSVSGRPSTLAMTNVIAMGTGHAVEVFRQTDAATARLDHVDADDIHLDGGGTVTDLGGNITGAPAFADAAAFDFHELPGSPTVDAGRDDALNGTLAFDGTLRLLGARTDIGAAEYIAPPTVVTGPAGPVGSTTATVMGSANPNGGSGVAHFDYGTTPAYGQQTSDVPLGAGIAPVDVGATITGLQPATTYHYRLAASNSSGTGAGTDATFTTHDGPLPPLQAPVLTRVSQTHRVWRANRRVRTPAIARRVPRGTRFSYTLSVDATVRFTVQRARAHRRWKTVMRLRRTAHSGRNSTRFSGRVGRKVLRPGRHRVVIRASNAAGTSRAKTLRFRVIRG